MANIIRLILLIISISLTIALFVYHVFSFYKYAKRGKYHYKTLDNQTYVVVKEGFGIENCRINGTTYTYYGEIDWLIKRSYGHFIFLFCFWGTLFLAFLSSIFGSILEYMFKPNMNCFKKFVRILRSTVYKSSISIPVIVLFAFNYSTPCLELRKSTFMLFSNVFTYIILAIQFPVLIVVSLDVIHELYVWKPNATYRIVKGSIKGQPMGQKILRIILYSVLFLIIFGDMILSFLIYLELLFLINIAHLLLVVCNILLSVFSVWDIS